MQVPGPQPTTAECLLAAALSTACSRRRVQRHLVAGPGLHSSEAADLGLTGASLIFFCSKARCTEPAPSIHTEQKDAPGPPFLTRSLHGPGSWCPLLSGHLPWGLFLISLHTFTFAQQPPPHTCNTWTPAGHGLGGEASPAPSHILEAQGLGSFWRRQRALGGLGRGCFL